MRSRYFSSSSLKALPGGLNLIFSVFHFTCTSVTKTGSHSVSVTEDHS